MSGDGLRATRATMTQPVAKPSWVKFEYRPAINGLRAIAAMLVVLFHAGMPGLDNGFVGVDVFFVLSGFLITSLIAREFLVEHRIKMMKFYARRARRLFPAALLVLVVTALVYVATAPGLDVLENRWGFPAAALYVSNWYFLGQSQDYFAQDASPSPVLHYWSLSVEEQFYLAWPLIMTALFLIPAFRRRFGPYIVAALALGALVLSGWMAHQNPMTSYFSTFGRAYQLLLGAALAMVTLWLARRGRPIPRVLARIAPVGLLAGVVLLVFSSTNMGPSTPFWVGVFGCLATVLIIGSLEFGARGAALDLLSSPVAVWLGIWSYSIYLWHWPLIVLGDTNGWLPQSWFFRVPMVALLSIGLAALTWLLVERRTGAISLKLFRNQRRMVLAGLAGTIGTALFTTVVLWPSAATQSLYDSAYSGAYAEFSGVWVGGDVNAERTVMIIGDSHAMFWRTGMDAYAKDKGFRLVMVTRSACPWMTVDAISIQTGEDFNCDRKLIQPAVAAVKKYQPDLTMLISRSMTVRDVRSSSGEQLPIGSQGWTDEVQRGMTDFLDRIRSHTKAIVILEPMPETATSMLKCLSTGVPDSDCAQPQQDNGAITTVERLERQAAQEIPHVVSVDLDPIICPGRVCQARVDGVITHRDQHHMTDQFAAVIIPQLDQLLRSDGVDLAAAKLAN